MSKITIDKNSVASHASNPGCLFRLLFPLAVGCLLIPGGIAISILCNKATSNLALLRLIPGFLIGIVLLVLSLRADKGYRNKLLEGNFYVIQNPLNYTGEEEVGDNNFTPYLYFNYDDTNGRYMLPCTKSQREAAQEGDAYYVILADNGKGGEKSAICCYPVAEYQLDAQLTAMLQRDTHLSGHPMTSLDEIRKKLNLDSIKEKNNAEPKPLKNPWVCYSCGEENDGRVGYCIYCNTSKAWSLEQAQKNRE